ncbi:hypothetical protein [Gracilinema caldarium]|nr:hypothetical protein [Gracilinema caldarium]
MIRSCFLLLCLFLSIIDQKLGAQNKTNSTSLSIYSDTSVNPWADIPKLLQQTDIRVNVSPTKLFIPLPRIRVYSLQSITLDTSDSMKLHTQESLIPKVLGVGLYAPQGGYRFLYGALSINGIEERIQNLWEKAFILPASYTKTGAELLRTTSLQQQQDIAGFISIPLGERRLLYSLLHKREQEHLHGTIGFETFHISGQPLRIEAGFGYHTIPETSANTWFSSAPFLPNRNHYITSISFQWFGPWLQFIGEMASSYTSWEGIGYYWKGAFAFGSPSFRLSGGYDTIQGPFRDSAGNLQINTPHEVKNRSRFQIYMRNKNLGNLILNSETRFSRDEIASPYYIDESKNYIYFIKGQLLTPWWIIPANTTLRVNYTKHEELPYNGALLVSYKLSKRLRQRQGTNGVTWWANMQNRIEIFSDQAQMRSSTSKRDLKYSCEGMLGIQFKSTSIQIGTTVTKKDSSLHQESINLKLSYKKDYVNVSSSVNIPLAQNADGNIQLSMTWVW